MGTAFGHAVVAAAHRRGEGEPGAAYEEAVPWRLPRSAREMAATMRPRRLRREVAALARDTPCRRDFVDERMRYDAAAGRVQLVGSSGWHYGPRGIDLAWAWATVPDPAARLVIHRALLQQTGSEQITALLLEWAARSHLGRLDSVQGAGKAASAVAAALERVADAEALAHTADRSPAPPVQARPPATSEPPAGDATYRAVLDPRGRWLRTVVEDWRRLGARSLERNVFYEPEMMVPALDELERDRRVEVLCVLERRGAGPERLTGVFPLCWQRSLERVPARVVSLWQHDYAHVTVPLVEADTAAGTLAAFWDFLSAPTLPELARLRFVPTGGPFWTLLEATIAERCLRRWCPSRHERAVFVNRGAGHDHAAATFSAKRRQEFRRLRRRLAELGPVEFVVLDSGADLERGIEDFLRLEDSGWKGRQGTSLRGAGHAHFFRRACAGLARQGRLRIGALCLDGVPIAMLTTLVSGDEGWAFKMAFDESFAPWSPGVQMVLEESQALQGSTLARVDSTAVADHELVNRMWPDRLGVADVVVARPDPAGAFVLEAVRRTQPGARRLKQTIRSRLLPRSTPSKSAAQVPQS